MIIIIRMIIIIMYKENKREFKNYEAIMIPTVKDNFTAFNLLIIWWDDKKMMRIELGVSTLRDLHTTKMTDVRPWCFYFTCLEVALFCSTPFDEY